LDKLGQFNQAQFKIELSTVLGRKKAAEYLKNIVQKKFSNE